MSDLEQREPTVFTRPVNSLVWTPKESEERERPANTSGVEPLDMRVLVKPDPTEKRTAGGIILPDANVEQKEWAQMKGTLVAVGVNAWSEASASRGFVPPEPGARVLFAKYGGVAIEGDDGEKYRIMNDEDVTAVLQEA